MYLLRGMTWSFTFPENHVSKARPPVASSIAQAACIRRKFRTRPPTVQHKLFLRKFSKDRPEAPKAGVAIFKLLATEFFFLNFSTRCI